MNKLFLLKLNEIDNTYNNTFYFKNRQNQLNYFLSKRVYTIDESQYTRFNQNTIQFEMNIELMENIDYIISVNEYGNYKFFFVNNKIYVNENVTALVTELDLIQTYLFDIDWNRNLSLVNRTHINPKTNTGAVDNSMLQEIEDLNIDHYNIVKKVNIFNANNFGKGGFMVCSSDNLGKTSYTSQTPSSTTGSSATATDNTPSKQLFKFLKGYEGFVNTAYQDSGGVWTIGYGITQSSHPDLYDRLSPTCTEEEASIALGECILQYSQPVYEYIVSKGKTDIKLQHLDAFTSLAYNCGVYGCTSSPMMAAYLNDENSVSQDMWNSYYIRDASGTTLQGLINRRNSEFNIYKNNIFDRQGQGFVPTNFK